MTNNPTNWVNEILDNASETVKNWPEYMRRPEMRSVNRADCETLPHLKNVVTLSEKDEAKQMSTNQYTQYRHIFLYAKRWYKESDNVWIDLAKIVGEYSGSPPESISKESIILIVSRAVEVAFDTQRLHFGKSDTGSLVQCLNREFRSEQVNKMFNSYEPLSFEDGLLKTYLSILTLIKVLDNDGKPILVLGKPDPKILPISTELIERITPLVENVKIDLDERLDYEDE